MHLTRKICLLVLALSLCFFGASAVGAEEMNVVTVTGSAVTEVAPNMAWLYADVEQVSPTAAEAREGVAAKLQNLKTVLLGQAIAQENVKTTGYNLTPIYSYNGSKRKQNGFRAVSSLKIKIENLDKLTAVLDKSVTKAGATISRVEFGLSDRNLWEQRLLQEAVTNARNKADLVATAGGRTLGVMVRANIQSSGGESRLVMNQPMLARQMNDSGAATGTELSPGTITVKTSVYLAFSLKPIE